MCLVVAINVKIHVIITQIVQMMHVIYYLYNVSNVKRYIMAVAQKNVLK